ncbi:tail fiber protein, partial [archaeon]|nr:tail fiber protein [archaeon]
EQGGQPYTKTIVQKVPGIISITPGSQNINKAAIPGTIFMAANEDGSLTGDLRIHDGITLGGISLPPPGTVFHMLTKKGNNQPDHMAGALNLGSPFDQRFFESSVYFPKLLQSNTVIETNLGSHMEYDWFWANTANLVLQNSGGGTTYDGSIYPNAYEGFVFRYLTEPDTTDSNPPIRPDLTNTHRPLAIAMSENVSCRYEFEVTIRALGESQYGGLNYPWNQMREHAGVLLAYKKFPNGEEHTLTAIRTPNAYSQWGWSPFEIVYNYGQPNQTNIARITEADYAGWGYPGGSTTTPESGAYYEYGYTIRVRRDKGNFTVSINAATTDMFYENLTFHLDIWDNPAFPFLRIFQRDQGNYGFVANHRDWIFSDIKFIDYEKDFETPDGYMFADGKVLDKNVYGALYSQIGDIWNTKTDLKPNEFQIPDLRGYFIRCYKNEYISGTMGVRTRKEDTIKKHGHYTLVGDGGGHMHQYFELGINQDLDKPPITPEGTVLNPAHSTIYQGPDSWRGVWAMYAPSDRADRGDIDAVNVGVERIQGSSVTQQNYIRHSLDHSTGVTGTPAANWEKFWKVPWIYKQYETRQDPGDINEHGEYSGAPGDDLTTDPDAIMLGEGTTHPLDIPQLHRHELALGDSINTPKRSSGYGWFNVVDREDGEGVPINIKIQTFIKY